MEHGEGAPVDPELQCTCDADDFGMGHGSGCPVGERNKRNSIREMCDRMASYGVPEQALAPIRGWLKILEAQPLAVNVTDNRGTSRR